MSKSSAEIHTRFIASSQFEAARQIIATPSFNRHYSRLHGHGFLVSAFVDPSPSQDGSVPTGAGGSESNAWPGYRGGEVPALLAQLQHQAQKLDYQFLNEFIAEPTDANIARWFDEQFTSDQTTGIPGLSTIALQSTPNQGVIVGSALCTKAGHRGSQVWRRYRFQAAHQLPNVPVGHKCGRMHGHSFEVVLYATSETGVVDYGHLDRAWDEVAGVLNHSCLNEIDGLQNPTSEVLSSWLWQRLRGTLPCLSAVTVYETASCGAMFDGDRYRIWKDFTIDSAVRYRYAKTDDPRARVHGYTYTLRLHLSAPIDQVMGWTLDFGDVKEVFSPIFKSLDHHPLHENPELALVSGGDTESLAKWLFSKAKSLLPELVGVDLFETQGCGSSVGLDMQGFVLPLSRL